MSDFYNSKPKLNLKEHWNKAYKNNSQEKLGWFETDLSPMLGLINKTNLDKNAKIINIGAGSTTLIDELIKLKYTNIIATDISEIALKNLELRVGKHKIDILVDDLTNPQSLSQVDNVDLWVDRAVLHFFTDQKDRETYFKLLSKMVKPNGYTILAQFNTNSAKFCSGLTLYPYDSEKLKKHIGNEFSLIDSFNYTYTMPSGDKREYIYTLFKKKLNGKTT
jgi:2-polyprenyl-3-methyl-5-hydroxy-6-metoxy-1,4-benzoquinol methylase